MDISVIIPSYKPGDYIWDCLNSIKSQTLNKLDFEILIVLNGCFDPWYNSISQYIENALNGYNVRLFHLASGGVSNARNFGLDNAKGKYIAFIDDDDFVSPCYLESLLKCADEETVVLSDSLSFIDGQNEFDYRYSMHVTYLRHRGNSLSPFKVRHLLNGPCMKLIPQKVIKNIRFNPRFRNGEDSLFIYTILKNISQFVFSDDRAIYYRRYREGSAVMKKESIGYIIKNAFALNSAQLGIYFSNILDYNFFYTVLRLLGTFKGALYRILNQK